jgi:hypothetical protein
VAVVGEEDLARLVSYSATHHCARLKDASPKKKKTAAINSRKNTQIPQQ